LSFKHVVTRLGGHMPRNLREYNFVAV
jgi:hypothetical protein